MSEAAEEAELLARASAGDEAAYAEIITIYQDSLYGYFCRLLGDAAMAEDLTQEVFINIYRRLGQYEPRAKFSTYLFKVARNRWIDYLRRQSRCAPVAELDEAALADHQSAPSPLADLENAELQATLQQALQRLSPEHRETFILAKILAKSYEEVARLTAVPVGTVKSRVFHANENLRRHLRALGYE